MQGKSILTVLNTNRIALLASISVYLVGIFLLPKFSHDFDSYCWGLWSERINKLGLASAYSMGSPVNYPPLYLYVLKVYGALIATDSFFSNTYYLKAFTLLFDIGSLFLLFKLLPQSKKSLHLFVFALLNIAYWYNTMIWNQVDGILSFFVFSSFYFAVKKKASASVLLFLLGINFKVQCIIFLPLLALLWLPIFKLRSALKTLTLSILIQVLILLPFLIAGNAKNIITTVFGSVNYYPSISMNAFNIWHFFYSGNLMFTSDKILVLGILNLQQIGLILFFIMSVIVLFPLFKSVVLKRGGKDADMRYLLQTFTLLSSFFFYFNTQMHERYIHTAVIFSTALAFMYKEWMQWIILSLAYTLSLESICHFANLPNYNTLIFNPRFIACLYSLFLLVLSSSFLKLKHFKTVN